MFYFAAVPRENRGTTPTFRSADRECRFVFLFAERGYAEEIAHDLQLECEWIIEEILDSDVDAWVIFCRDQLSGNSCAFEALDESAV